MRSPRRALLATSLLAALVCSVGWAADELSPDAGFKLLLNGQDLSGWQTKAGESLDGQSQAFKGRFTNRAGILLIDPAVKGDVIIQTTEKFGGDVDLKFEFMAGDKCNNDLFFRGIKFDITKSGVKNLTEGKWQVFEITVRGNQAEFKSDGELQRKATAKPDPTPFGIRAEFGTIQFRKLQIKTAT